MPVESPPRCTLPGRQPYVPVERVDFLMYRNRRRHRSPAAARRECQTTRIVYLQELMYADAR
jgi:hypothetical protein